MQFSGSAYCNLKCECNCIVSAVTLTIWIECLIPTAGKVVSIAPGNNSS